MNIHWKDWCRTWSSIPGNQIKPVSPKGNQSWIFIGRTGAEPEAPILSQPDAKSWLIGKDPDAWKDWRQEEKGMTEDETVGWHHWLNRHKFEQMSGGREGQESLECCSPWVSKSQTQWSNWITNSVQCYKPLSVVLQALCLSNLIPWIYFSLPLYNHKGFDLGHTWMI